MFDQLVYRPAKPTVYEESGLRCLNSFRPSTLVPIAGDVSPWLNHVKYFFGDRNAEMNHFLDVLAYKVQNPSAKIRHALCLGSKEGGGKGTIERPFKHIFGEHNHVQPRNDQVIKNKMGWVKDHNFAVIHELRMPGDDRRFLIGNLKDVITEPTINIELKYIEPFQTDCILLLLCFTNHMDELYVAPGDRRWWLFKSTASPLKGDAHAAHYGPLHRWLDGDGPAIVYDYLLKRDVSHFNPDMRAPDTPEKLANADNSRGEVLTVLSEAYEDKTAPFQVDLINIDRALKTLRERLPRLTLAALKNFLREQGCEPLPDQARFVLPTSDTVHKVRLWAIHGADPSTWAGASREVVGKVLFEGGWTFSR
jgi:hypothetical protein